MTAKEIIDEDKSGVFTEIDIAQMMHKFAKYKAIEIIKKLSKTEAEYQYNIKYVFPEYNIR